MSELKPCPFCGGEAELVECDYGMYKTGHAVYCGGKCHAKLGVTGRLGEVYEWTPVFSTEAEAIAEWNTRYVNGQTSDGYHTFDELYHHRAVLFSVIVENYRDAAWKAKKHHDGTMYDGMFIVGIDTPWGQASYHYDLDPYWDMFDCEERESAPEWDGHTPDEAIERIGRLATLGGGKLTAEQVREAIFIGGTWDEDSAMYYVNRTDMQAIADELNALLGSDRPTTEQKLPAGLTISDDGTLLNWCGENYTKQDVCGDDRFELIDRAKRRLLESTNIESRPEEVAVLDSILFRCWQMGWLYKLRDDNSRYSELFGTPERAARTLARMCQGVDTCGTCPLFGAGLNHCKNDYRDFASIAEWLRGDA